MSNYTQTTNFTAKDALLSGNPAKLIKGADYDVEFAAIAAAIATKLDSSNSANPSSSVGLTAVNGSSATYMRSDGAPALSQAIVPTWTGVHTFSATPVFNSGITVNSSGSIGSVNLGTNVGLSTGGNVYTTSTSDIVIGTAGNANVRFYSNGNQRAQITSAGVFQTVDDGGALQTVGWRDVPQSTTTSSSFAPTLSDRGKSVVFAGSGGVTFTIPANASVAFPLGTVMTIINNSAGSISIAITSDTLVLAATVSTGTRTLAVNGVATIIKYTTTGWYVTGAGLT